MRFLFIIFIVVFPVFALAQEISGNFQGGSIKAGNDTATCNAGREGALRYNTTTGRPEFCDGTCWLPLSVYGIPTSGLVTHYKLDESSGTTASAAVGGASTLTNTPTWQSAGGKVLGSLSFAAGSSEYGRTTRTAAIETAAITVAVWAKRSGAQQQYAALVEKTWGNHAAPSYVSYSVEFSNNNDNDVTFTTGHSGAVNDLVANTYSIGDGVWTHVVATYNPAASAPQKKLYINGTLVASSTLTSALVYNTTATGDLYMGQKSDGAGFYNGALDDVRIYNRALSAQEVTNLYNANLQGCS